MPKKTFATSQPLKRNVVAVPMHILEAQGGRSRSEKPKRVWCCISSGGDRTGNVAWRGGEMCPRYAKATGQSAEPGPWRLTHAYVDISERSSLRGSESILLIQRVFHLPLRTVHMPVLLCWTAPSCLGPGVSCTRCCNFDACYNLWGLAPMMGSQTFRLD